MIASPLCFVLASACTLDLIVVLDTFGCGMENSYSGSVHQCFGSAPEVNLLSALLQLRAICSALQTLRCVVERQVVQHLTDSTTAVH